MASPVTLRPPTFSKAQAPADYQNPSISWMMEEWHVTHSTLPMWKDLRNVRIKYTPLDPSSKDIPKDNTDRVDDNVSYQKMGSTKLHVVSGIDKAASPASRGEWDWRGSGWLKVVSSHWEILGWGIEEETGNKWAVTCFAKTVFTPAGIDIYCQDKAGITAKTLEAIKKALAEVDDEDIKKMAPDMFAVTIDNDRKD